MKPKADADNGSACAKPNPATNNQICGRIKKILPSPDNTDLTARKLFKRGNKNVLILKVPTVLWSRSNFDRLRLPAPGKKNLLHKFIEKIQILKIKEDNCTFLKMYLFVLSICEPIVII